MKTKVITTLKKDLLIVELPRKSDVEIFPNSIEIYNQFTGQEETIKGSYTLLGKPDEIKDEDVVELFDELECENQWCENGKIPQSYGAFSVCYECDDIYLKSFHSALESEIYWENPISKRLGFTGNVSEIDKQIALQKQKRRFKEAQEKTFNRNRTLIFVKD